MYSIIMYVHIASNARHTLMNKKNKEISTKGFKQ